jgi:hypothetical protein
MGLLEILSWKGFLVQYQYQQLLSGSPVAFGFPSGTPAML